MPPSGNDLHLLLLRLAGQVPDDVTATARSQLAQGELATLARTVASGVLERRLGLDEADRVMLTGLGVDPGVLPGGGAEPDGSVGYVFSPNPAGPAPDGGPDRAAAALAAARREVRGLWRTWRWSRDAPASVPARRVYVVEVDTDPIAVTARLQDRLVAAGERYPQVEVYALGADLPAYQRVARAEGELLWARSPATPIRNAALFDGTDPWHGPYFRPDHDRIEDESERLRLVDYLAGGEPLLVGTGRLEDVVEPDRGPTVPVAFRTDGTWVWADATTYYLEHHRLAPDAGLVGHIRALDYRRPQVDGVALHRALAALVAPPKVGLGGNGAGGGFT